MSVSILVDGYAGVRCKCSGTGSGGDSNGDGDGEAIIRLSSGVSDRTSAVL